MWHNHRVLFRAVGIVIFVAYLALMGWWLAVDRPGLQWSSAEPDVKLLPQRAPQATEVLGDWGQALVARGTKARVVRLDGQVATVTHIDSARLTCPPQTNGCLLWRPEQRTVSFATGPSARAQLDALAQQESP